jgi:4-amino-4-deoxy-L-arabinose transferase-like glycosyltransferase
MSRAQSAAAVLLIWALIFLPGLGSTELKGEEGRRILPAIAMLEGGDWIVPSIGGEPYLRKPPLINWLIAASIQVTGSRSEWAARLPSVLAVLALALTIAGAGSALIGVETAFVAATILLTNIAIVEKGRLAEIEAVYTALSGIAIVLWLTFHGTNRSAWLTWTVPFLFLGLAMLAKGPLHLLFFYAIAGAVLHRAGNLRAFCSLPHLAGLLIMTGIFAAWAIPYFAITAKLGAAGVWSEQMRERAGGGDFELGSYLLNFPRAFGNFLPWLVFVPQWWQSRVTNPLFRPVRDATALCFIGLLLIPGVLPRYTLPLFAPASIVAALALQTAAPAWMRGWQCVVAWWSKRQLAQPRLAFATGCTIGVLMIGYAFLVIPRMNARASTRALGREISRAVPAGAELLAFDIGFQPALFYIPNRIRYVSDEDALPDTADHVLVRGTALGKLSEKWEQVSVEASFKDKADREYCVVSLARRRP